jgi:6-phosphogluconolactonase
MHYFRYFAGAALLCFFLFPGCSDRSMKDTETGPAVDGSGDPAAATAPSSPASELYSVDLLSGGGAVYTLSNGSTGNSVLRFSGSGNLSPAGSFSTGGKGTGAGLGSQGALARQGNLLYAVNAGSNDVSVLRETGHGLVLVSKTGSGGENPVSLTVRGNLLYVLNAGGEGNITGFHGAAGGFLQAIPGSTRPLSGGNVGPAQIQFSPDGRTVVVTEKATNNIDTYTIGFGGKAYGPHVFPSSGETPYGFDFTRRGTLVVSDAVGGAAGQSALTSYFVSHSGFVHLVTGPVPDGQTAACWVAVTHDGRFAYTTNTGSNNISGYSIDRRGRIVLFNDGGATATSDAGPLDLALTPNSRVLYALNGTGQSITSYRVNPANGTLTPVGKVTGLPAGAAGLVAE